MLARYIGGMCKDCNGTICGFFIIVYELLINDNAKGKAQVASIGGLIYQLLTPDRL